MTTAIKHRSRLCLNCKHGWISPVQFSDSSPALSGEKTEQCPKCETRNVMSSPAFLFSHDGVFDDKIAKCWGPRIDGSKIQIFAKRSQAEKFAKSIGLTANNVCHLHTRFQLGYGIFCNIGRGYLVRQSERLGE